MTCFPTVRTDFLPSLGKTLDMLTLKPTPLQSHRVPACACGSTGREGGGHALWVVGGLASTSGAHGQCAIAKDQPPNASCFLQMNGGATLCCHQMLPGNPSQNLASSQVFWIGHAMGTAIIRVSLYFCVPPMRARFQLYVRC